MIALVASLVAQAVVSRFAPPLDRPIAYSVSETRVEGAETRRFAIERRVTFRADGDAVRAEVETLSITGDAGRAGKLFEAMMRSTVGETVVLTLDRSGNVIDVVDLDAVWDRQIAAMAAALGDRNPARASGAIALLAPLKALPRESKVARVGEMITAMIANQPIAAAAPHPFTLPARGQAGASALLAGTEQVTPTADGLLLLLERTAGGAVSGAPMTISQRWRIDPRTGLIAEAVNISTAEVGGAVLRVTRTIRSTP